MMKSVVTSPARNERRDGGKADFPATAMMTCASGGSTRRRIRAFRMSSCIHRCSTKSVAHRMLPMVNGLRSRRATTTVPSAGRRSVGRGLAGPFARCTRRARSSTSLSPGLTSPISPAISRSTISYLVLVQNLRKDGVQDRISADPVQNDRLHRLRRDGGADIKAAVDPADPGAARAEQVQERLGLQECLALAQIDAPFVGAALHAADLQLQIALVVDPLSLPLLPLQADVGAGYESRAGTMVPTCGGP